MILNKEEVQQRTVYEGGRLPLELFEWDENTNTFSTKARGVAIDLHDISDVVQICGDNSTQTAGWNSTQKAGDDSTQTAGKGSTQTADEGSTQTAEGDNVCSICIGKSISNFINYGDTIQFAPYGINKFIKNGMMDGKPHIIADGILSEVINQKGNIYKVINHGETEHSWLIKEGDNNSHGKTLKEARESLVYKLSNRDTSEFQDYHLESILNKEQCIKMYRSITGACPSGTRYFVESLGDKVKNEYSVKEVIDLTSGKYNHNLLAAFFNKEE